MRFAALVALLVLVPGATAANEFHVSFVDGFSRMRFVMDGNLEGTAADSMRSQMDADRDGEVVQEEADAFRDRMAGRFEDLVAQGPAPKVDGGTYRSVELLEFTIGGAPGPVQGGGAIAVHSIHEATFEPAAGDRHTFETHIWKARDPSTVPATRVTIVAPAGYVVAKHSGFPPGATVSEDRSAVEFLDDNTHDGTATLEFEPAGGKPSPPPAALAAALGVLAAAAVVRKRRDHVAKAATQ